MLNMQGNTFNNWLISSLDYKVVNVILIIPITTNWGSITTFEHSEQASHISWVSRWFESIDTLQGK
jgi:hypothetical protein